MIRIRKPETVRVTAMGRGRLAPGPQLVIVKPMDTPRFRPIDLPHDYAMRLPIIPPDKLLAEKRA